MRHADTVQAPPAVPSSTALESAPDLVALAQPWGHMTEDTHNRSCLEPISKSAASPDRVPASAVLRI